MSNSRSTLNVLFYIKKTVTLKDGQHPIYCRITVNGSRAEFSVNRTITAGTWNQQAGKSSGKDQASKSLNQHLEQIKAQIYAAQTELIRQQGQVTAVGIKSTVLGLDEKPVMVLALYDEHNQKLLQLIDNGISKSTYIRHCTTRSHLSRFMIKRYRLNDIPVRDVSNAFIREFDHYLRVDRKCNNNSSVKYQKNFKKIIKYALDNGWIGKDPFTGIRYRFDQTNKPFLTSEELALLSKKNIEFQRLIQIRDIFLFCCFTGLSFVDVKSLRKSDLKTEPNGRIWIEKPRQKTKVLAQIPLLPEAFRIVNLYKTFPGKKDPDLVLPVPSNQKMNAYLKEIATICGIDKDLTTHVARHTFATTIALANHIPMEVIAKVLGHSSTKETGVYAVVEKQMIGREMERLMHPAEFN